MIEDATAEWEMSAESCDQRHGRPPSAVRGAPTQQSGERDQSRRREQRPAVEPSIQARPDADLKNKTACRLDRPLAVVVRAAGSP